MKESVKSVIFMFVISLVFTSLVTVVKMAGQDRIDLNARIRLERVVLGVLGMKEAAGTDQAVTEAFGRKVQLMDVNGRQVYVGYGDDGKTPVGIAFPVGGPGFWGPIQGLAAVDPKAEKLIGVAFYKHGETPGLGGRITEPWFTKQFKGLPVFPIEGDKKIFYLQPEGSKSAANDLDAITGASNTSKAVETFLNRDVDAFLKETFKPLEEKLRTHGQDARQ